MLCLEARRQHVENELLALAPWRIWAQAAEMVVHWSPSVPIWVFPKIGVFTPNHPF